MKDILEKTNLDEVVKGLNQTLSDLDKLKIEGSQTEIHVVIRQNIRVIKDRLCVLNDAFKESIKVI